jgi:hypothetical protein
MRLIHLADIDNRDSYVQFVGLKAPPPPVRVAAGKAVTFRRFVAATDTGTHDELRAAHGADYGAALVNGDPEVDVETIGQPVERTSSVYLSASGEVLRVAPKIVEILFGPDGAERQRRDPVETASNVQDGVPVRWSKLRVKRADAVRKFAFARTVQLVHVDGLTYDYLHGLAKRLDEADELVLLGGGARRRARPVRRASDSPPRVGSPWRGAARGPRGRGAARPRSGVCRRRARPPRPAARVAGGAPRALRAQRDCGVLCALPARAERARRRDGVV